MVHWMGRPWPWFHGSVDGSAVAVVSWFSGWVGRGRGSMVQWMGRPWPWFHGSVDGSAVAVVSLFSGWAGRGRGSMVQWTGRPWPWFHGSLDGPAVAVVRWFWDYAVVSRKSVTTQLYIGLWPSRQVVVGPSVTGGRTAFACIQWHFNQWNHAIKFARWQHPAMECGAKYAVLCCQLNVLFVDVICTVC